MRLLLHVVVIGGGVIGMFSAYYLIRNGFSVTIIDKSLGSGGTSVHNAGLIVPSFATAPAIGIAKILSTYFGRQSAVYISPSELLRNLSWLLEARRRLRTSEKALIEFGMRSLALYKDFFAEESVDVDLVRGVVGLYKDTDFAKKTAQELNGQFIDGREIQQIGFTGLGGGVTFEEELSVNPAKLFNELRKKLSKMGAKMILGKETRLQGVRPRISLAMVDGESLAGDAFVVAAGAWSREICAPLGYNPPIIPARGLAMIFDTGGDKLAGCPTLLEDYGVPVIQHNQSTLSVTGFFELRGFDSTFGESRKSWLLKVVNDHLTGANKLRYVKEGVGYRPCTPDQLPVIGKVPGYENLFVASGHCRLGVTLAAATGDAIASLLAEKTTSDSLLQHFEPARFT
jgi:D-amino-acid dehydrogenase